MYSPEQPRLVWKIEGGSLSTRARGRQTKTVYVCAKESSSLLKVCMLLHPFLT